GSSPTPPPPTSRSPRQRLRLPAATRAWRSSPFGSASIPTRPAVASTSTAATSGGQSRACREGDRSHLRHLARRDRGGGGRLRSRRRGDPCPPRRESEYAVRTGYSAEARRGAPAGEDDARGDLRARHADRSRVRGGCG